MVNSLLLTGPGTASLDFRDDGNITGFLITGVDQNAGGLELSFNSAAQLTTNDTQGVLAGISFQGSTNTINVSQNNLREPVQVGERIYLHVTGALNSARVFIYTDAAEKRAAPRRR